MFHQGSPCSCSPPKGELARGRVTKGYGCVTIPSSTPKVSLNSSVNSAKISGRWERRSFEEQHHPNTVENMYPNTFVKFWTPESPWFLSSLRLKPETTTDQQDCAVGSIWKTLLKIPRIWRITWNTVTQAGLFGWSWLHLSCAITFHPYSGWLAPRRYSYIYLLYIFIYFGMWLKPPPPPPAPPSLSPSFRPSLDFIGFYHDTDDSKENVSSFYFITLLHFQICFCIV